MDESTDHSLHERIASLEAQVDTLRTQVERLNRRMREEATRAAPPFEKGKTARPVRKGPGGSKQRAPRPKAARAKSTLTIVDWLSRLGIVLVLIGLAYLFKLGIDRGLLTPVVRVLFGAVLGVFLLGAGLKLRPTRLALGRVLLGGSIATFYVTIYAAFHFYSLVVYPVAFGAMAVVTIISFVLAVQQRDAVLAILATIGGLGTPFFLYTGEDNIPGLVLYTCIVLAGAGSIYLYRGWRSLLLTASFGGWMVLLAPWFELAFDTAAGALADRQALQAGLIFSWLAFGVMPALREVWHHRDKDRWVVPPLKSYKKDDVISRPALALVVIAPLLTLLLSYWLWEPPDVVWGLIEVGLAMLYAGAYVVLRRGDLPRLASAHGVAAALLLASAWFALFDDDWLWLLGMALEVAVLHVLARALSDRALRFLGHAGFVIVAFWVGVRVLNLEGATPVLLNGRALTDLVVLALIFVAARTIRTPWITIVYRLTAYVGLLGWFWRDLVVLPEGEAFVSIAWGLCALTTLALGWRGDIDWVRNTGLATLLVVIGKLFLVDLARLEAVWRILLFLGLGGLLLLLTYFFPKLWHPDEDDEAEEPEATPSG